MSDQRIVDDLGRSAFVSELSPEELGALAGIVTEHSLADGEVFVAEGARDERMVLIAEGKLAVERHAELGGHLTVAVLGAGEIAGELGFIDGSERHSSLVAIGPTRVIGLTREALERQVDEHPRLVWHVLCAIIRRAHQTQRRLAMQALELSNYVFKQHGRY